MHEPPQGHASVRYAEGFTAEGGEHSRCLEWHQNRRPPVALKRLEFDSHQPTLWDKPPSGCRLDWQGKQARTRQCHRRAASRASSAHEHLGATETGGRPDEIAGGVRATADAVGWSRRGRVSEEGMQRRTQAAAGAQLAEAARIRTQAAGISACTGDRPRSCQVPARAQKNSTES